MTSLPHQFGQPPTSQEARKDYAQLPLDFLKELREADSERVSKMEEIELRIPMGSANLGSFLLAQCLLYIGVVGANARISTFSSGFLRSIGSVL